MMVKMFSFMRRRVRTVLKRIKRFVFFDESQIIYNGKTYKTYWNESYGGVHHSLFHIARIKQQAKRAFLEGGFRPDEFFLYGLENQKRRYRDLFISQREKDRILISFYGRKWKKVLGVLKDKHVFYSFLKEFFNRDVIYVKSQDDRPAFLSFSTKHSRIFAKLNKGNCGRGAKVYSIESLVRANEVFDELISSGEWIVEEVIEQDSVISHINSTSINTVRFPSFKKNGVVKCVYPCMRFGRAGSIVDNAGQGGVFVSVDSDTGEVISDAFDEKGNVFVSHPDSNFTLCGFHIPHWKSLVELVKESHLALPDDQVYVAFDFALSKKGWCLVEGNWGDWILQQASLKKGFKNQFVSLLNGDN